MNPEEALKAGEIASQGSCGYRRGNSVKWKNPKWLRNHPKMARAHLKTVVN